MTNESNARRRKNKAVGSIKEKGPPTGRDDSVSKRSPKPVKSGGKGKMGHPSGIEQPQSVADDVRGLIKIMWVLAGLFILVYTGYWFAWYVEILHENNMWFTNIKEVEREISLRTEAGLYYSYYKQLVAEPRLRDGIDKLTRDNVTEHGRSINILARFNVHQEVVLAAAYKALGMSERGVPPIFFYIRSIFRLNGFYISALFACAWYMSGSWLAGLLAAMQFVANLDDTTRVFFTINLREGFGFPFLFAQIFFLCWYLERGTRPVSSLVAQLGILVCSFLFAITWQFNQFIMLLQAAAVYALGLLQLAPIWKVRNVLFYQGLSLLAVGILQYYQPMILGSILLSFVPSAILMLYLWRSVEMTGGILEGAFRIACQVICVLFVTFWINWGIKQYIPVEADEHIFKFLRGKFGFGNPLDFESRIYLCHGAFIFLDNDFFRRTSETLLFPSYFLTMLAFLFLMGKNILLEWCTPPPVEKIETHGQVSAFSLNPNDVSEKPFVLNLRPNVAYLTIQSVLYGILALMTLRMKYLWSPFMIILGSFGLADREVWSNLLSVSRYTRKPVVAQVVRHALPCIVMGYLLVGLVPRVQNQLTDYREFWDPDTVELMGWINNNTKQEASFAGSMQLLAGVKCCTGRHITNHPHFEDKWLRDRTKEVYQMYARRHPEEVYATLKRIDTDYIILEDSICLAPSDNCRLPDLVDLDNGHIPDNGFAISSLKKSEIPRFCVEIRYGEERFTQLFKLVMENRTFRVYQLL